MPHLQRAVATLRLFGDDLVPDDISALLGCQATYAEVKGQKFSSTSHSGVRTARTGQWRLAAADTEPEDLDTQVAELLGRLTQDLSVWRGLSQRFQLDLFCGWFMSGSNEGVVVSSKTLTALGERGIKLSVDIYAPEASA